MQEQTLPAQAAALGQPAHGGRQSNIELLRVLCILGVIVLHYNNANMGGGFNYVQQHSANQYLLFLLESAAICAVDLFMLISGYFMVGSYKRSVIKPLQLLVQVMVFSLLRYLAYIALGYTAFSLSALAEILVPANYFAVLYIVTYFVSPYINLVMNRLSREELNGFFILVIVLFSAWPTAVDVLRRLTGKEWMGLNTIGMYGGQYGYTAVNFILLYITGAYLRLTKQRRAKIRTPLLVPAWLGTVLLLTVWALLDRDTAWEYCNFLVIAEAVLLFLLFEGIRIPENKIINHLARASFAVYLVHAFFLPYIRIQHFVQGPVLKLAAHIALSSCGIYLLCWVIYSLYDLLTAPLFRWLAKKLTFAVAVKDGPRDA